MANAQATFTSDQLKLLLDSTAGWARDWDDVVFYLKAVAADDTHLPDDVVEAVRDAVLRAKQHGVEFTTDYRAVWEATTGHSTEGLPAPEVRYSPTNPIELERNYLADFTWPNGRAEAYAYAERRGAPWRVLQTIRQLPNRRYRDLDDFVDAIGDIAWNPHL
jgi:hypothetical protein